MIQKNISKKDRRGNRIQKNISKKKRKKDGNKRKNVRRLKWSGKNEEVSRSMEEISVQSIST